MPSLLPHRLFGSTGVQVPLIGYGTAPLGNEKKLPFDHCVRCLHHAIDSGITYLDTSPDYGSEPRVGEVMKTRRDEVFLATKVNKRSRDGALDEIKESLEKLHTDHVDLIQIHSVSTWADWEQIIAPDGVLAGVQEAREQGMARYIGITGHARPEILAHALKEFEFDSVLVALGAADRLVSSPETFLLPVAQEQGTAVIAMKVYGHGSYDRRDLALRYSLGLPGVSIAIVGLDNEDQIDQVIQQANDFKPLNEAELEELVESTRTIIEADSEATQKGEKGPLFWFRDTNVMGWSKHDEPSMVRY